MIPNNVVNIIKQFAPNVDMNCNTPDEFAQMMLNSGRVANLTRRSYSTSTCSLIPRRIFLRAKP